MTSSPPTTPLRQVIQELEETIDALQSLANRYFLVEETPEEVDLYEILELSRGASREEIKKAYKKAALSNHPDKVHADFREDADIKFKAISQAYEILYDDEKRAMYDLHGMAAFDTNRNRMSGSTAEDLLAQIFGMSGGGMPPGFGGGPRRPRRGADEEQEYAVTLEELYKGKSARFASTKNVVCTHCKGKGGKENAKAKQCDICHGRGTRQVLRSLAPGLATQETVICDTCKGSGSYFKEKDKCKKCKGKKTTSERKILEIYIPRGSKHGEKIVLAGEADQEPDQQPGDIVFTLKDVGDPVFKRHGADLHAHVEISLAESLCGFSRPVIKHLDGRGIHLSNTEPNGRVIRPGQVLKVPGEGMPYKKSDLKGDLFLTVDVVFPKDGLLNDEKLVSQLQKLPPAKSIYADTVDEVEFDADGKMEDIGTSDGGRGAWVDEDEDEDDEGSGHPQCAQQ